MKQFIIGLLAFALTLGLACKKEKYEPNEVVKKEIINKKSDDGASGGIGGYPGGQYTYPNNTGICYCGNYPTCHPTATDTKDDVGSTWPPK